MSIYSYSTNVKKVAGWLATGVERLHVGSSCTPRSLSTSPYKVEKYEKKTNPTQTEYESDDCGGFAAMLAE
jgi:hypothetical protein